MTDTFMADPPPRVRDTAGRTADAPVRRWLGAGLGVAALGFLVAQMNHSRRTRSRYSDRRAAHARPRASARRVVEAVTINQPIERVQDRWERLDTLPETLRHLNRIARDSRARSLVKFTEAPGGRGTEIRIELDYDAPRGGLGAAARLMGTDPASRLREDLRRFKQMMETGDVVLSEGPALWRPGRPARDPREIRQAAGLGV